MAFEEVLKVAAPFLSGGFFVGVFAFLFRSISDKKKLYLSKLEEIALSSDAFKSSLLSYYSKWNIIGVTGRSPFSSKSLEEYSDDRDNAARNLRIKVNLFAPRLIHGLKEVYSVRDVANKDLFELGNLFESSGKPNEAIVSRADCASREIFDVFEKFDELIVREAKYAYSIFGFKL